MATDDRMVWLDCEMTGLSLENDALVEVACIVTGPDLVELDEGFQVVIKPPDEALAQMDEFVVNMHTTSGLINELAGGTTLVDAQVQLLEYLASQGVESGKAPLCGSSVYVDRGFLARDMPRVNDFLHYRLVDVSSYKEMVRRWYPRVYYASPDKHGGHRALADTVESIAELRYYRDAVFVPLPGPDTSTAREIAKVHELPA